MKQKQRLFAGCRSNSHGKFQKGIGVLFIVVMLAFLVGIVAVIVTRTDVQESAISGNDIRAREAHEAAQAGVEYALGWLNKKTIMPVFGGSEISCPGDGACPSLAPVIGATSGESYSLNLRFVLSDTDATLVRVISNASNPDHASARVEVSVRLVPLLSVFPPPLVINGGLEVVLGNPAIDTGNPPATAILTNGSVDSVKTGNFNITSSLPLGPVVSNPFLNAWSRFFTKPLGQAVSEAEAAASVYPAPPSAETLFYYWDSSDIIKNNYGSADRPVVIIIPATHCPDIRGGVVIYGIIYFTGACSNQGWGNAEIYGSVIAEGSISKLNANAVLHGLGSASGGVGGDYLDYAVPIPGTWKDF